MACYSAVLNGKSEKTLRSSVCCRPTSCCLFTLNMMSFSVVAQTAIMREPLLKNQREKV